MTEQVTAPLTDLYEKDEIAWLDIMAELIAERRWDEIDADNLCEYLKDMAISERREVHSRLWNWLTHMLKWHHQPEHRSRSWQTTIDHQRFELNLILENTTLRNHALAILAKVYDKAREQAAKETGLPTSTFPAECPYSIEHILGEE